MSVDFAKVQEIASASLMPDFFAVRIDEEGLFDALKQLLARIKLAAPHPQLERLKQLSATAPTATAFMDAVKQENLFTVMREIVTKVKVA